MIISDFICSLIGDAPYCLSIKLAAGLMILLFVFHETLAGKLPKVNSIDELRGKKSLNKSSILAEWQKILLEDNYRRELERARSKQDVPHRFVSSFTAEVPRSTPLHDFHLSLIETLSSGGSYTIFAGFDVNHDGNPLSDRVGTLRRNTYKGDKYANLDVRLSRVIRLSERARAEVIAEGFNVFNTLNITEVNTVYGAPEFVGPIPKKFSDHVTGPLPSFGSIRAIAPPRQLQFALRLYF